MKIFEAYRLAKRILALPKVQQDELVAQFETQTDLMEDCLSSVLVTPSHSDTWKISFDRDWEVQCRMTVNRHDIGKTLTGFRHVVEGGAIINEHFQFDAYRRRYASPDEVMKLRSHT